MGTMKPETKRRRIRQALLDDLKRRGIDSPITDDLVEGYMQLYDLRLSYRDDPKQLPIICRQMDARLKVLGVSPDSLGKVDDDDAL